MTTLSEYKEYIMQFSRSGRRKRKLDNYQKKLENFRGMDIDELGYEYIEAKTGYENNIIVGILIMIWVGIFLNIYYKFILFVWQKMQYIIRDIPAADFREQIWFISPIIAFGAIIFIFNLLVLRDLWKDAKEMRKNFLLIEKIIKENEIRTYTSGNQ